MLYELKLIDYLCKVGDYLKRKFLLATIISALTLPIFEVGAAEIYHVNYNNKIYSISVSQNGDNPFSVYIEGEYLGDYGVEDVLSVGFKESTLIDLLRKENDRLAKLSQSPNDQSQVSNDGYSIVNFTSPDQFETRHADLIYPGDPFADIGRLSPFENYNGDGAAFERMLADYAYIAKEKGIFPSVMIGQALLESGPGGGSGLALTNKNIFGIKGEYNGNGSNWDTLEDYGGMVKVNDKFRLYPTYKESVMDYVRLLTETDRYSAVLKQTTPEDQVAAIRNAGYATDSAYTSKVINIINKNNLKKYD